MRDLPPCLAHRQKQRFIQRLRHTRQSFAARKVSRDGAVKDTVQDPIPTLPSTYSIHDFHNFSFQGSGISPGLHFHLSATINALTDIPLVPTMNSGVEGGAQHRFMLHWLNNKEIHFSIEAGKIMRELAKLALKREDSGLEQEMAEVGENKIKEPVLKLDLKEEGGSGSGMSHAPSVTSFSTDVSQPSCSTSSAHNLSLSEALDQKIEALLRGWHQSSDLLFSVHPVDGSLLVWVADFLDEYQPGEFRQAQVSFSSRIPNAIPIGDASTMSSNITVFNPKLILNLNDLIKESILEDDEASKELEGVEEEEEQRSLKPMPTKFQPGLFLQFHTKCNLWLAGQQKYDASPAISMISKHQNGSLNLWDVTFSPDSSFSQLLNIGHKARVNGHRFRVNDITSHPVLPLLLTTRLTFPPFFSITQLFSLQPSQHGIGTKGSRGTEFLQRADPLARRLHLTSFPAGQWRHLRVGKDQLKAGFGFHSRSLDPHTPTVHCPGQPFQFAICMLRLIGRQFPEGLPGSN